MKEYTKHIKIKESGLSTAECFLVLQQVSGEHCDLLGFGMDYMGPKELIWVVVRQKLEIARYPEALEELTVNTWPGPARHGLFPRHYEIMDGKGEIIATGSALWTLVGINSRKMIKPENYGIDVPGVLTGREKGNPRAPEMLSQDRQMEYVVPEEFLDGNGHMNNTCYYRMAEECIGDAIKGKTLCAAATEYANEALLGDKLKISIGQDGARFYVTGETDSPVFKMLLEYK